MREKPGASLCRRLADLDTRIEQEREYLERLYAEEAPAHQLDEAWLILEGSVERRDFYRAQFAGDDTSVEVQIRVFIQEVHDALTELADKFAELAREVSEQWEGVFSHLSQAAGLTSHVLDRLMKEGEASKKPGPRQIFSPAVIGIGPITRQEFRSGMPNRRPILRGFQRQQGKG